MCAFATPKNAQTFRKAERLTSRKIFDLLVTKGRSVHEAPFRLIWLKTVIDSPFPAQVAFAVPKKNFKSAVKRNRIRRMMREVYRKNKAGFYPLLIQKEQQLAILLVYSGKTVPEYAEVEQKIKKVNKTVELRC